MSFSTVRDEIKTILESATGIGEVHDYVRHTAFWGKYYQKNVKNMRLNVWEITRRSREQEVFAVQASAGTEPWYHDEHETVVLGHMAVNDEKESEKTFQDVLDNIVAKFRVNNFLNGTVILPRQMQIPIIEHRMFGAVLVHYTEMTFAAIERVGG